MPDKLEFLTSNRFWALVLLGLSIWFHSIGWIPVELASFIEVICGGHIGIKTLDRFSEKFGKK